MKLLYFIPILLGVAFAGGFFAGDAAKVRHVKAIINYAAQTPTTEAGGEALRRHPEIGVITNILIEPGRLSVFGRDGSRIWYYPPEK